MDIQTVAYHVEFYTGERNQVEHYRMPGPFVCPRVGERVHLHHGSLTMDVSRVVHDLVEHDSTHLEYTVKVYGDEVPGLE